jgi:hypothetical protein
LAATHRVFSILIIPRETERALHHQLHTLQLQRPHSKCNLFSKERERKWRIDQDSRVYRQCKEQTTTITTTIHKATQRKASSHHDINRTTTTTTPTNAMSDRSPLLLRRNSTTMEDSEDARKILATGPTGVRGEGPTTLGERQMVEMADIRGIVFPWDPLYQAWWSLTAVGAIVTAFFCPFHIAFENLPGAAAAAATTTTNDYYLPSQSIEWVVNGIFCLDIVLNFNLAFYKHERIVFERQEIAVAYVQNGMFGIDLMGVFPFETLALALTGELGKNSTQALLLSLLRCLRFVRLHRMKRLSDLLQYNARVSLLWFTMIRNFATVILLTHCEACALYFSARLHDFDEGTWLGPHMADEMSTFQCYVTALYLSIVTFCTVGYGDFRYDKGGGGGWSPPEG